ncbi:hypothetical protein H1V43_32350 [Streptomyces sp. PSKA54]|uniref:Uncharacterized protein n=1 Tax=Streptomyces himalayensis subsp. aureolus TaxID=2758039 RepID=A0A7W2D712_9ACTN|nr:hypothetical protein [Streptomyces himalayensis]MBA4865956.1 hypothetical protein [Streptomyces himalayensis subsp. aureolus]
MTTIAPNPHSPYADADPTKRHIFASPIFFGLPDPGVLAPTACERLAVVPEEPLRDALTEDGALPDGLCRACVAVMQGAGRPARPETTQCGECGNATWHSGMCAVCRQQKHDEWWPTREEQPAACDQCKQPFDPSDTRFDGRAQHRATPFCRRCVDRCHDTEIADHRCAVCR